MKNVLLLFAVSLCGCNTLTEDPGSYPDPGRYAEAIAQFEASDRQNPPPPGAVLCIGSSSMRGWHDAIEEDLSPLTLIKRGFGGSTMLDVLHYADRIVLPYEPRAIVLYEGDNDVAEGVAPEEINETFGAFAAKVHAKLPECRIYVLSIKPSPSRWTMWSTMQEANRLLAADCTQDERLTYVDVASRMLDAEGQPRKEIFKEDDLHMLRGGYEIWRDALKQAIDEKELQFEDNVEEQAAVRVSQYPEATGSTLVLAGILTSATT